MRSSGTRPTANSHERGQFASDASLLEKLYIYETVQFKDRALGYAFSTALCFGYCVFNENVLSRPDNNIIYECLGLAVVLSFFIPIVQVQMESSLTLMRRSYLVRATAVIAAFVILVLIAFSAAVQAKMVDNRLKRAIESEQFEQTLPDVQKALLLAKRRHISVPPDILSAVTSRLLETNRGDPNFWPAAAMVINYRSPSFRDLPDCLDAFPEGVQKGPGPDQETITATPTYTNCRIDLTDPRSIGLYGFATKATDLVFNHCLIHYDGKPIFVLGSSRDIKGALVFNDCAFDISITSEPLNRHFPPPVSADGKGLIDVLLAAQGSRHFQIKFGPSRDK
jgi:hypothetical protein